MLETSLYNRCKPHFDRWGTVSRVENTTEPGMWDVHYCFEGVLGWIETKVAHSRKLYFEKFQIPWGTRYSRAGAKSLYVLAEVDGFMHVYHVDTVIQAPRFKERKWTVVLVDDLEPRLVMRKPYDWDSLRRLLVSS